MPMYDWRDTNTNKVVTILRSFNDYEIPPDRDETAGFTDEEFAAAKWERIIGGDISVQKGAAWGWGKGYW